MLFQKTITVKPGYELHKLKSPDSCYLDSDYVNYRRTNKKAWVTHPKKRLKIYCLAVFYEGAPIVNRKPINGYWPKGQRPIGWRYTNAG